jgi:histone-lysine N-methyltransferase SETD2
MEELPQIIQPYVDEIIDVRGDGHCGFRAAAYCLGKGEGQYMHIREKVAEELRHNRNYYMRQDPNMNVEETLNISNVKDPRPCGVAHWMCMPSFGRPMANAFKTAVFFYSEMWSESFFPDFSQPNDNPPIIFALIHSAKHFVPIRFKD